MLIAVVEFMLRRSGEIVLRILYAHACREIRTASGTWLSNKGHQLSCDPTVDSESFVHSLIFSLEGRAWQEPEPSHMTGMVLAHCIMGKYLGVVCHCFPPPSHFSRQVPPSATTREILAAKGGIVGEKDVR